MFISKSTENRSVKTKKITAGRKATDLKKKVLIIDDHIVVRRGLIYLINREEDFEVCGEAEDARKGLNAINELAPDIVLVDISLPGMNGIEFIKNAKARHPGLPIVVLSMHDESLYTERAIRAGALGYVMKRASSEEIIAALRKALQGELQISGSINATLLQKFFGGVQSKKGSPVSVLSDRELEVFELIGHGKTTREIADVLHLSPKTIDCHRMHIKEKLTIQTTPELVQRAVHHVASEAAG
jgi:DNA-binding NarL/FixJ family response regulator